VTVVALTSERRHMFHELLNQSFFSQIYPPEKLDMLVFESTVAWRVPRGRFGIRTKSSSQPKLSSVADFWMTSGRVAYDYEQNSRSAGYKRKALMRQAKGDVIVKFDDNDFYNPHYIRYMVEYLMKHPEVHLLKLAGWYSMVPRRRSTPDESSSDRFAVGCYDVPGKGFGISWATHRSVTELCDLEGNHGPEESTFFACIQERFSRKAIHQIGGTHGHILQVDMCFGSTDMAHLAKVKIPMAKFQALYGVQSRKALEEYSLQHIDAGICRDKFATFLLQVI